MSTVAAPSAATPAQPAPDRKKLAAAARQFEAIFVRQMLASARQGGFGDPLFGGQASDTFHQMQDERFADIAADKGVLGLAATIEKQLASRQALAPTPAKGN